jgi:hypothetical protein
VVLINDILLPIKLASKHLFLNSSQAFFIEAFDVLVQPKQT